MEWVANERRKGAADPLTKSIADTAKNIGNAAYGGTIMDKSRHQKTIICNAQEFNRLKYSCWLKDFTEHGKDVFELQLIKRQYKQDTPIQVGYSVLQYAKLRMLEFKYDFMAKYIDDSHYQYILMDTDSAYMALTSKKFEDLVKPSLVKEFEAERHKWLPRTDDKTRIGLNNGLTLTLNKYDTFTPGLFKTEKEGRALIALTCKTNCFINLKDEVIPTCKGIVKKDNSKQLIWDNYKKSLFDRKQLKGTNIGFRYYKGEGMMTYKVRKIMLSPIYTKAVVMDDGVHIRPIC
jgi:hypothetical protein